MADTVELVASWIVAGLVTVAGVILAHRQSEKSRQRQEDRVTIYEPIHRELEAVLSRGPRLLAPMDIACGLRAMNSRI